MSRCKGCGREILFIRMKSGSSMPCDPELIPFWWEPEGKETFITQAGEAVKGSRDGDPKDMTDVGYIPHWMTCETPERFRR